MIDRLASLLLLAAAFSGCGKEEPYVAPVFANDLAISRFESIGNVVFAGGNSQVALFTVTPNGELERSALKAVDGQVQDMLATADGKLYLGLPGKLSGYHFQSPQDLALQFNRNQETLARDMAYTNGQFGLLGITDTLGLFGYDSGNFRKGQFEIFTHFWHLPDHSFFTPTREPLALVATGNSFIIAEDNWLVTYPANSLSSGNPAQLLPLLCTGLQATADGLVAVTSSQPRVLTFYQLVADSLQFRSQLPLGP